VEPGVWSVISRFSTSFPLALCSFAQPFCILHSLRGGFGVPISWLSTRFGVACRVLREMVSCEGQGARSEGGRTAPRGTVAGVEDGSSRAELRPDFGHQTLGSRLRTSLRSGLTLARALVCRHLSLIQPPLEGDRYVCGNLLHSNDFG
jgi:hypothetical protein